MSLYASAVQNLEEEFRILANPNAEELVELVGRKETLVAELQEASFSTEQVKKIRDLTCRNQMRLSCVSRGVSSALGSFRELQSGPCSALHYARDGRRSALREVAGSLSRRA